VRVAVDQSGEERLVAAVVDIRVRVLLEHLVTRPDCGDRAADDGKGDVVLHEIGIHDGGVPEHDRSRRGLRAWRRRIEEERGGAGADTSEKLAAGEST
jgi:hypothetical protein